MDASGVGAAATILEFPDALELKRKRIVEMHELFDAVSRELELKEVHVFTSFYADRDVGLRALGAFLLDVSTCPSDLERYCRDMLEQHRRKSQGSRQAA